MAEEEEEEKEAEEELKDGEALIEVASDLLMTKIKPFDETCPFPGWGGVGWK